MADPLAELFRTFNQSLYRVMAGGRGAPSEARMEAFEKVLDFQLPTEYRNFTMSPLGGLFIEVREEKWPRPKPSTKPSWKDQFGLKIFGISAAVPEWLDLREELMRLPEEEGDLVPFMARTGLDDRFCYDLDGQIVYWSRRDGQRQPVDLGFNELVLREIRELDQRQADLGNLVATRRGKSRRV